MRLVALRCTLRVSAAAIVYSTPGTTLQAAAVADDVCRAGGAGGGVRGGRGYDMYTCLPLPPLLPLPRQLCRACHHGHGWFEHDLLPPAIPGIVPGMVPGTVHPRAE